MTPTTLIDSYLECLRTKDLGGIATLFAPNAIVCSPLYGEQAASGFFESLFAVTEASEITLHEVFESVGRPESVAARFHYRWTLGDGSVSDLDVVDLFELSRPVGGWWRRGPVEIVKLTIIYDTHEARPRFEEVRERGAMA